VARRLSTATPLSLSVKRTLVPCPVRAQPSGWVKEYRPGWLTYLTKARLSGMSPGGLLSAGTGASLLTDGLGRGVDLPEEWLGEWVFDALGSGVLFAVVLAVLLQPATLITVMASVRPSKDVRAGRAVEGFMTPASSADDENIVRADRSLLRERRATSVRAKPDHSEIDAITRLGSCTLGACS
jgi:hypothetical protein